MSVMLIVKTVDHARDSATKAYFNSQGVRRGYELGDTDTVDLLIEEKYSALDKTEDKEEEIEVYYSEKEREMMTGVIDQIRRGSLALLPDDVGGMSQS